MIDKRFTGTIARNADNNEILFMDEPSVKIVVNGVEGLMTISLVKELFNIEIDEDEEDEE